MTSGRPYHHGDLRNALRAATVELIGEVGPGGFSLREAARRAGVSHAAPAHHFGDRAGLLTAVAVEGFETLQAEFDQALAAATDPVESLVALSRAYVRVARRNRAHYAVMFREDLLRADEEGYQRCGLGAFGTVVAAVERLRDHLGAPFDVPATSLHCWSTVHGLSQLHELSHAMAQHLGHAPVADIEAVAELCTRQLVEGLRPRGDG